MRTSDKEAHERFVSIRFAANNGEPFCPHCGNLKVYTLGEIPVRWKCAGCRRKFSVTSGALFHPRKLPIKDYLAIVFLFVNGVKGKAALHIARDINVGPKAIFVLLHKLREAMGAAIGADELEGEVEIDGAYFGSRIRPANRAADRRQQRRSERQVVVVARERGLGHARAWVVSRESEAVPAIRAAVASGTEVHADEAGAWDILHASFPMKRVNHSREFKADDGACTNQAEATSPGFAALSSAFITGSAVTFCRLTRTNALGGKTTGAWPTARSGVGSSVPLSGAPRALVGPATGIGSASNNRAPKPSRCRLDRQTSRACRHHRGFGASTYTASRRPDAYRRRAPRAGDEY
jgi:transposase-like protein